MGVTVIPCPYEAVAANTLPLLASEETLPLPSGESSMPVLAPKPKSSMYLRNRSLPS